MKWNNAGWRLSRQVLTRRCMPSLPTTASLRRASRLAEVVAGAAAMAVGRATSLVPCGGTRRARCQLTLLSGNTVNSARCPVLVTRYLLSVRRPSPLTPFRLYALSQLPSSQNELEFVFVIVVGFQMKHLPKGVVFRNSFLTECTCEPLLSRGCKVSGLFRMKKIVSVFSNVTVF